MIPLGHQNQLRPTFKKAEGQEGMEAQVKPLLMYQSLMLLDVAQDMKDYVKGKYASRRKFLMGHFEAQVTETSASNFSCCDLCSKAANLAVPMAGAVAHNRRTRSVSSQQKNL